MFLIFCMVELVYILNKICCFLFLIKESSSNNYQQFSYLEKKVIIQNKFKQFRIVNRFGIKK